MELEVYNQIKISIKKILGIDLEHYKEQQMRRRLDSWLARVGAPNWDAYFEKIQSDKTELRRFRDFITINVTEFFRDQERWDHLQDKVLPALLSESRNGLRIWSAGCSKGAEIYSVAMILEEISRLHKHYLLASDLDKGALNIALNGGPYVSEEIRNVSPVRKSTHFISGGPPHYLNDNLKSKIKFKEHDLLKHDYEKNLDLIICRNVVIYFTAETKQVLFQRFNEALRKGGILFVGGTEIIPRPQEIGFKSSGFSFYIKE